MLRYPGLMMPLAGWIALHAALASADVSVRAAGPGEVLLSGDSCKALQKERESFCEWRRSTDPAYRSPKPASCRKLEAAKGFALPVQDCVPPPVLSVLGLTPLSNGPNCWGAAMFSAQIRPAPAEVSNQEFLYWMESPLCRMLSPGEAQAPGDVIRIRGKGLEGGLNQDIHAFVRISRDLCFSKNGTARSAPYGIYRCQEVFDEEAYRVNGACKDRQVHEQPPECERYSTVYRCMSMDRYLAGAGGVDPADLELLQRLVSEERELSNVALGRTEMPREVFQAYWDQLTLFRKQASDAAKQALEKRLKKGPAARPAFSRLAREILDRLRADGQELSSTLAGAGNTEPTPEALRDFKDRLRASRRQGSAAARKELESRLGRPITYLQDGDIASSAQAIGFGPSGFSSDDLVKFALFLRLSELSNLMSSIQEAKGY